MLSYEWTSAILGTFFGLTILYLIRHNHLHSRYALWWLPAAIAIAFLGVFPSITDWIAPFFGINYPPVLVLVIGMGVILIKMVGMDIERSRDEVKLQRLIQRVAILEGQIDGKAGPATDESSGTRPPE